MDPIPAFLLGMSLVLAIGVVSLVCVQRPLTAVLVELCGAEHRARFWVRLYDVFLILAVCFFALGSPPPNAEPAGLYDLLGMFRAGLFGLLFVLLGMGVVMLVFVLATDRKMPVNSASRSPGS